MMMIWLLPAETPELTQPGKDSNEDTDSEDDKEPVLEAIAKEKEAQQECLWRQMRHWSDKGLEL
jgi:hypothetical protein